MKKIMLITLMLIFPATGWAVDGYKNLKFGSKKETVTKNKLCHFVEVPPDEGDIIERLQCNNFKFNGASTIAGAYFIEGKFMRFAFQVPSAQFETTLEALIDKYGRATSQASTEELRAVERYPNRSASYSFDKDTIMLTYESDENGELSVGIIYSSPNYMSLYKKKSKAGMKDSL